MPIYQYKCSECEHSMEALQKMSDPKLLDCPACDEPKLVKQLTAAAFKLKGTGWYETDFKNSGAAPKSKSSSESSTQDSSESSATNTKPSSADSSSASSSVSSSGESSAA